MQQKNDSYMIASGWWCSGDSAVLDHHRGDSRIRDVEFHHNWYQLIDRFTSPSRILIVDSASPVPPPVAKNDPRIHVHTLAKNPGHATVCEDQFCGWTAAVLVGLQDCLHSDNEYFVYIEQDVLIYGQGIIEYAISKMKHDYMFGDAIGIPQPLQQSFFIIRRDGIAPFLSRILAMTEPDRVLSPERKFHYATLPYIGAHKAFRWLGNKIRRYDFLPFGYGRKRPIEFLSPYYYFQHGSADEIASFSGVLAKEYGVELQ